MNPAPGELAKLNSDLKKMKEFHRFAQMYGGRIRLGGEIVSIETIEDLIDHLKFQIAALQSQSVLKIIPKEKH